MFCPVCGNEENEPMIVNGAKVCQKCGCVIEKNQINKVDNSSQIRIIVIVVFLIIAVWFCGLFILGTMIGLIISAVLTLGIIVIAVLETKNKK